jgi:uncharacterized protein
MLIGVLSDTHGTLHPRVLPLFSEAQVECIWHAGDVGDFSVIRELQQIAPVTAVCGNVDTDGNSALLPGEVLETLEGIFIYMTHIGGKRQSWYPALPTPKPQVAICGHSHIALLDRHEETLFLNPGTAGTKRRFNHPLSVALLRIIDGRAEAEIINL